ncbi:MAG: orotate phosphoribosyltransferase [Rickettsiales bacterium]|jgi:orotate phosphoribosyltransferase|nr:orotate phosphoribosyltransferase [Rickettsiales bacterium]
MKEDFLKILKEKEGVLEGHFCLTSGLHSNMYFQCAKLYQYPDITAKFAKELVQQLESLDYETIVSPAIGAIIIGYETAKQAGKRSLFVERKDDVMQLRRGYTLKKGEKIVILEDVITTARTVQETLKAVASFEPKVVGVACIVDRSDGNSGFDIKSVLKIRPEVYKPEDCYMCKAGIPIEKPGSRKKV